MRRLSTHSSPISTAALRAAAWATTQLSVRRAGQGLVEYGLILVLIMVVCVAILTMVGQTVNDVWYSKLLPAL